MKNFKEIMKNSKEITKKNSKDLIKNSKKQVILLVTAIIDLFSKAFQKKNEFLCNYQNLFLVVWLWSSDKLLIQPKLWSSILWTNHPLSSPSHFFNARMVGTLHYLFLFHSFDPNEMVHEKWYPHCGFKIRNSRSWV